ncbi:MauE/DoxX family redox-associated membrane protein [Streptomyces sp. NPDC001698]|uniref:MauE/DoxX family redox-associated membrane protein n=1 Tax=Streptomyces sp. NPDC001698 TaxID=3364601 RepID=UPI00368D2FD0
MGEFQFAVLTWQGFLLIAAAAAKVRAPRRFAMAVAGYRLAPSALVEPLAWSVPGVEVILGAGLISGWHPTIMLRLAAALFASFGLAMALALLRGRQPSCGCGVGEDRPVSWLLVARAGGLAIFAGLSSAIPPPLGLQVLWRATSGLSGDAALATLIALLLLGMTWRALTVGLRVHNRLEALRR